MSTRSVRSALADVDVPTVTVVVCTHNRPTMLRRALASVVEQEEEGVEIVVVDDGSRPAFDPSDVPASVRVIRTDHQGVGSARAAGVEAARGELIAFCDDDDEWRPGHLRALRSYLHEHPEVDLVYADSGWLDDGAQEDVPYSIDFDAYELAGYNFIFPTDAMARAGAVRRAGNFDPTLRSHEDWDLWLRMSRDSIIRHLPEKLATHHWHARSVSAAETWRDRDVVAGRHRDRFTGTAGWARAHGYDDLDLPAAAFDPRTWIEGRQLLWHSLTMPNRSWGYSAHRLTSALERQGVDLRTLPSKNQRSLRFERYAKPVESWSRIAVYFDPKRRPSVLDSEVVVVYDMWESTEIPAEHVDEINRTATLLYVPCRQNLEDYVRCGVHVPVRLLHHGVDPDSFPRLERAERDTFTFGTFGDLSPRKGIDVLVRAFRAEFGVHEGARLLLKSTSPVDLPDDPRIRVVMGFTEHEELLRLLKEMDAFVLPSRGEGFGNAGVEAMATGLPLIATNWSGPADYLDESYSYPLDYRLVEATGTVAHHTRFAGRWAEPDEEHLRYLLRRVFEHREESVTKGRHAAEAVRSRFTWDHTARQMCGDFDELAGRWSETRSALRDEAR
jgi:glycosyltransferase involved in cell wall biosynthesis